MPTSSLPPPRWSAMSHSSQATWNTSVVSRTSGSRLGTLLGLPRLQTQIDRRPPRRLVHPVPAIDPVQDLEPQMDRVETARRLAIEAPTVHRIGEALPQDARFEERLAQAVEKVVAERQ